MEVVWAEPQPVTANEIVARLESSTDWKDKTIKTMLNRLVKKGALGYEEEGKRYLYKPKVARDECVRVQSRSFLSRVLGGRQGRR
jgi:BlaI family penicillinase repressor